MESDRNKNKRDNNVVVLCGYKAPRFLGEDDDLYSEGDLYTEGDRAIDNGSKHEKYLIDNDDFLALHSAMKELRPLSFPGFGKPRFNTATDVLREKFVKVDEESGSYKITKINLSGLHKVHNMGPRDRPRLRSIIRLPAKAFKKFTHLQELRLDYAHIDHVPKPILLHCKDIRFLSLKHTQKLERIPDEIEHLSELRELHLDNSAVKRLPGVAKLARLRNLRVLGLRSTSRLVFDEDSGTNRATETENPFTDPLAEVQELEVPIEKQWRDDGGIRMRLENLRELDLRHSGMTKVASPSNVPWNNRVFQNLFLSSDHLRDLDLSGARHLTSLPDVVRDMAMLERLDLSHTDINSLPPTTSTFFEKLDRLRVLSLTSTPLLRKYERELQTAKRTGGRNPPLRDLVLNEGCSCCPNLGCLGLRRYQTDGLASLRELGHALARNRARSRIAAFMEGDPTRRGFPQTLWSVLLSSPPPRLMAPYAQCSDTNCDCLRTPEPIDALFGLLVTFSNEIFKESARTKPTETKLHKNGESMDTGESMDVDGDDFVVVGSNTTNTDAEESWTILP